MNYLTNTLKKIAMSTFNINNVSYSGKNIVIKNGKVIIDGKDVTPDEKEISITVNGNIEKLSADACDSINVTGDCGSVKTMSGYVEITGNVTGSIETMSGSVMCKNVGGDVETASGSVDCADVTGDIETMSGNVKHKKI